MAEKTEEKKKGLTIKIPKLNPWMVATVILAGVLTFVLVGGWTITGQVVAPDQESIMSAEDAANKAIEFINTYLLGGQGTATLISVEEVNGLYNAKLNIGGTTYDSYITMDGKLLFPSVIDLTETPEIPETPEEPPQPEGTIGNFLVSDEPVCEEDGKPIIYFFGSQGCGYCKWEHPIVENVTASFEGYISFHNNMDNDKDRDIFSRYSTGGIPTIVLGCKYYRQGAGTRLGEEQEKKVLTAIICKLTNNQPTDVCAEVEDLIEQV